jgi:hypothetical protein
VDWINRGQDRDPWWVLVERAMNFRIPTDGGILE